MKILVTGGAGFVGSSLCERLQQSGHSVSSVDNYFTGSMYNHVDDVTYYDCDTKNILTLGLENDFELVYHLGEYSRVEQSYDDLNTVLDYNLYSIAPVVEFAKKCNAKLIYSGSSTKFSAAGGSLSPYAWTKAVNVDYVKNYSEWYGLDYAITYFYNVYGNREICDGKYSTVVAKFLKMKREGATTLPVTSPGTQQRNFTHVDDIVDALILIGEHGKGDGYGIGSDDAYSIVELAEMIGLTVDMRAAVKGNRLSAPVKSEKTIALGWNTKRNLKEYIKSCL